jgi:hypothetical protein
VRGERKEMIKEKFYNSCKAGDLNSCKKYIKEGGKILHRMRI